MTKSTPVGEVPHAGAAPPVKPHRPDGKTRRDLVKDKTNRLVAMAKETVLSAAVYKVDVLRVRGVEKHGGQPLSVLYVGTRLNLAYLLGIVFDEYETTDLATDLNPLRARSAAREHGGDEDLRVLDLPWPASRLLPRDGMLSLAPWLRSMIAIGDAWSDVVGSWRSVKTRELRKIRKYGLEYRLTDDEAAFRDFYREQYVPLLMKRFGDAAWVEPEGKVVGLHVLGELIEVLRDDTVVASAVIVDHDDRLDFLWTGAPQDLDPALSDGAMGGLYYYMLRIAYERGFDWLDCYTNRPTLDDGVLRYKARWGAQVTDWDSIYGEILLEPVVDSPSVRSFLAHNPLITNSKKGFVGRCYLDGPKVDRARLDDTVKQLWVDGLAGMRIYAAEGFTPDAASGVDETDASIELVDVSGGDLLTRFCAD